MQIEQWRGLMESIFRTYLWADTAGPAPLSRFSMTRRARTVTFWQRRGCLRGAHPRTHLLEAGLLSLYTFEARKRVRSSTVTKMYSKVLIAGGAGSEEKDPV